MDWLVVLGMVIFVACIVLGLTLPPQAYFFAMAIVGLLVAVLFDRLRFDRRRR